MRDLKQSDRNKITIYDGRSDTEIELYYRNPTTSEEIQYQTKLIKRHGKKIKVNAVETRLEMGLKILTGFRTGDFGIDRKPISSDPESKVYLENWKEYLEKNAIDVVTAFAYKIFEGTIAGTEGDFEEEEADDVIPPFQKKSDD